LADDCVRVRVDDAEVIGIDARQRRRGPAVDPKGPDQSRSGADSSQSHEGDRQATPPGAPLPEQPQRLPGLTESRILSQDRLLELSQTPTRVDAELPHEAAPGSAVHVERVSLAP